MTERPKIEVLICTIDGGIESVPKVLLPPRPDVGYLVSWQHTAEGHCDLPESLSDRKDVRVTHLSGRGLSANRNHALSQARGEILLIADDDVAYGPESFDNILRTFGKYPDASLICFQALDEQGKPMRNYPDFPHKYEERPYGSFVCSWEIALRNSSALPRFDERFGLGAPYLACGEEEIFVEDVARQGLGVRYEPLPIVRTDSLTTGTRFMASPAVQRSKGAVLYYMHGFRGAFLRCVKCALHVPGFFQRWKVFVNLWNGIRYIQRTDK